MLTDYVLGLLSSPFFVGCGIQIHFGPLWIANPWAVFSSIHTGSWLLLCLGLRKFPSRYIEELCVLWAVDFHNCGMSFPYFWDCGLLLSSIVCLGLLEYPSFGLQLSCFGHVRAKNNSEFPCRLELCFAFVGIVFAFFTGL